MRTPIRDGAAPLGAITAAPGSATPDPTRDLVEALNAAHGAAPPVRAALAQYVRHVRDAEGAPPERVLVRLKALLRPYEVREAVPAAGGLGLREQLVQWAIAAYYHAD